MADSSAAAESYDDDVEEFLWVEDEGEMGIPMERFTEVYDLMRSGNHLFRAGRFEEAISFYSKAQLLKPGDPIIISNRCIAFCRISHLLMQRSASDSEHRPLNGLDPTTHAELALKDAEKVFSVRSNSPKSYLLKAKSLILLHYLSDASFHIALPLSGNPPW